MFDYKGPLHRVSEKKGEFEGKPTAGQVDRSVLIMPDRGIKEQMLFANMSTHTKPANFRLI